MSARKFQEEPLSCVCGHIPAIHKTQAGHTFVFYLSCTTKGCRFETEKTDRQEDAVSEWNELMQEELSRRGETTAVEPSKIQTVPARSPIDGTHCLPGSGELSAAGKSQTP